jgi:hypothetical protein
MFMGIGIVSINLYSLEVAMKERPMPVFPLGDERETD